MTQNKSMYDEIQRKLNYLKKKVYESKLFLDRWLTIKTWREILLNISKAGMSEARGHEGCTPPQIFRPSDIPAKVLIWKQLCYFWNNVTLLWVSSLLELGLVLGKITLVLVGVNTHGQSSHQVLDRRSPNYPQLSDHYLNCTTEKDLTRRPEWTLFEQAVFSPLPYWNSARLNFTCDIHWIEDSIQVWFVRHPKLSNHYLNCKKRGPH